MTSRAGLIALLVTSVASVASGTPEPIQVALSAPAECPKTASLIERVAAILGGSPQSDPSLLVGIAIEGGSESYRARVHTRMGGVEGERELEGDSCEAVIDAVALVLALLLRPHVEEPEPPGEEGVPELSPQAGPEPQQSIDAPAVVRLDETPFGGYLRLAIGPGYGTLPGASAAFWFAAGLSRQSVALELRAGAWWPKSASSTVDPAIGGSFLALDGVVALCVRPEFDFGRWDSCAGFDGAWIRAEGRGSTQTNTAHTRVAYGLLEQALAFDAFGDARLRVAAQGLLPLGRPRFSVESVGEIHRPAAFALRGEVGLELEF